MSDLNSYVKNKPEVSVIIPVYNAMNSIKRGLESVRKQSLKNVEIIVVNDGSTDDTAKVINEISEADKRLIIKHQDNKGAGAARNAGIDISSADYLYFMDADDEISPDLLKDNVNLAKINNADIVIFGYKKIEKLSSGKAEIKWTKLEETFLRDKKEIKKKLCNVLDRGATFAVWNKIFRRELIELNNVVYPDMKRNQDMVFTLRTLKSANSIYVNNLIYYTYDSESAKIKYDKKLIEHHLIVFDNFYNLFENWQNDKSVFAYTKKLFVLYFFHSVPFFVVRYDDSPKEKIDGMFDNELFASYLDKFKPKKADEFVVRAALKVMQTKSSILLITVTKLKLWFTQKFGKNIFRNLLSSPTKKQVNETE